VTSLSYLSNSDRTLIGSGRSSQPPSPTVAVANTGFVRSVVVLGYPGIQALDLVGPVEVFTGATMLLASHGRFDEGYAVTVVSSGGLPVATGTGLELVAQPLPDPREPVDTLVLPGGGGVDAVRQNPDTIGWIQIAAEHTRRVVSVCTGSFIAAQAGLLDGCTATTHWAFAGQMAREFPLITVDPEPIFVRSSASFAESLCALLASTRLTFCASASWISTLSSSRGVSCSRSEARRRPLLEGAGDAFRACIAERGSMRRS